MFDQQELHLLCDVFSRCRIQTAILSQQEWQARTAAPRLHSFEHLFSQDHAFRGVSLALAPSTVFRLTDSFDRRFLCLELPDGTRSVLCIGPFVSAAPSRERLLALGEANRISPQNQHLLTEYFGALPILTTENPLFVLFATFCEHLWDSPTFEIHDVSDTEPTRLHADDTDQNDTLLNIKAMEQRYAFENELLRAVSLGQLQMESQLFGAFQEEFFEQRLTDPLRNSKNYCVIMNTLLRKAAEHGGVHPLYLDRISSAFAAKIEALPSTAKSNALMLDMFRGYCRLVREQAMRGHSRTVQNTLLLIGNDLSADLSLGALSTALGVSAGYLSAVFKKETGQTLSAYVRQKRMETAGQLLRSTDLQVQTVAAHCGILDTQYFSKLFKQATGKTPKEFRAVK